MCWMCYRLSIVMLASLYIFAPAAVIVKRSTALYLILG